MLGKACKVLSSSGIAPNTRETWNLLEQKHPRGPVPSHPEIMLPSESFKLPPDLDIRSVLHQFPRDSACSPSGLRIQHLIEAAEVHLPISICSSLRAIVNILADGRAPIGIAKFLAGGSLTALMKNEEGSPLDISPIVVGETLRRLTGKCLCIISRAKASEFFYPFQLGVAYPAGAEKLVHGFCRCISEHCSGMLRLATPVFGINNISNFNHYAFIMRWVLRNEKINIAILYKVPHFLKDGCYSYVSLYQTFVQ